MVSKSYVFFSLLALLGMGDDVYAMQPLRTIGSIYSECSGSTLHDSGAYSVTRIEGATLDPLIPYHLGSCNGYFLEGSFKPVDYGYEVEVFLRTGEGFLHSQQNVTLAHAAPSTVKFTTLPVSVACKISVVPLGVSAW